MNTKSRVEYLFETDGMIKIRYKQAQRAAAELAYYGRTQDVVVTNLETDTTIIVRLEPLMSIEEVVKVLRDAKKQVGA